MSSIKRFKTDKHYNAGEKSKENIEVWEDLVNMKDLACALIISSLATLGGYFLAPNEPPQPLIFGLLGALTGFILSSMLIKPKRIVQEQEREE